MKSKSIQVLRVPSLVLAAALQVLPIVRAALPAAESTANVLAIIFRWAAGAAALGAVDAVSGASTVITSSLATNIPANKPFTLRLTTAPNQAHYWTATGLPAGLALSGVDGSVSWSITGTPTTTGTYSVPLTAKDAANSGASRTTSATLVITVSPGASPPTISSPPASLTVTQNQSASFFVTASGTAPLTYQWRFKGANLSGQTATSLAINPATTNNAGNYDVIVANSTGSVTSSVATLTVIVPVIAPSITSSPSSLTVTQNQSASFSVAAGGSAPLNYQWRFNGANLSGQTATSLVINPATTNNAGNYDVVVANSAGSVTSAVAVLTVTVPVIAPSITSSPSSLTVTQNQSASFSVAASGSAPLTYQWRFNGANLSGQTATSLVINPATTNNAGNYDVIVANSAGSVTSAVATLSVIVPVFSPTITAQPSSLTVTQNQSATFSVAATGTAPLSYQWRFKGANLSNQTATSLVINPVTTNNAGNYDVVVANSVGSVTSSVATLTVVVLGSALQIVSQPSSLTVTQNQSATFSVTASGTAPLSYQWRFKGTNLQNQTSTNLVINPATTNNAGNYDVLVSNGSGSVTSAVAALTVIVPVILPSITSQPASLTVTQNQSATFSVAATGSAPLSYQWRFNGANLSGQTATSLVINPATTNNAGSYSVVVANSGGSVTSSVVTLTVIVPVILPSIASQPSSLTVTQNQSATFSVTANGSGPLSYQWRFNGANLSSQTASSLVINPATTNNTGAYDVVVANSAGSVTSSVATLTVIPPVPVLASLTVQISGSGTVNPNYNGQSLEVGKTYTMTATAGAGYYFTNWTGSLPASTPTLTFVMQSNLVLRANFVSDFATFVKGTYRGLFTEDSGAALPSSGAITLTTTALGKYSGNVALVGKKYSFSGKFDLFGRATNSIIRSKLTTLSVELALDKSDPDHLAGRVTDGTWSAPIEADRVIFDTKTNPAPQTGSYTIIFPGTRGDSASPAGDSFGTLKVTTAGVITFSGKLADGTKITQSSALSKNGDWPFYVSLYSSAGSTLGWLLFTNTANDDISGRVVWIRWQQPSAKYYSGGFTVAIDARASKYVKPAAGQAVLAFSNGNIQINDGNLTNSVTGPVLLGLNNRVSSFSGVKATLTVAPATGIFTGSFVDPATSKSIPVQGVVLQKQNFGSGYFLGKSLSGQIYLGP